MANRSFICEKFIGIIFTFFIQFMAMAEPASALSQVEPSEGVWQGMISDYPIMLCVEGQKAAYYYAGKTSDIPLTKSSGMWTETVQGRITGLWYFKNHYNERSTFESFEGDWKAGKNKKPQSFRLERVSNEKEACSSELYKRTLLAPDYQKLTLELPQSGKVSAMTSAAIIRPDGSLWMWGERIPNLLGDGSVKSRRLPLHIGDGYVQIAVGSQAIGIKNDGSLWGWGDNSLGQLGGEKVGGLQAVKMGDGFVYAAAADRYSFAIKKDGTLWSWGGLDRTAHGEITGTPRSKPILLGKGFVSVSARDSHFAAIKHDGTLWMWGSNWDGQFGNGRDHNVTMGTHDYAEIPIPVGQDFAQVSVGYSHTAAIKRDGSLWIWGHGSWGKLGDGTENNHNKPIKIGDDFAQVAAGFLNTLAIKKDGSLWAWGGNQLGIFGDCTTNNHLVPIHIGDGFIEVAAGKDFWLALKKDGTQWTWGIPWEGDQMDVSRACRKPFKVVFGDSISKWEKKPEQVLVAALAVPKAPSNITRIAAGASHSALIRDDGSLWTWGNNEYGQLADGTTKESRTPKRVGDGFIDVNIDMQHTIGQKSDGSLWRWGVSDLFYLTGGQQQRQKELQPTQIFPGFIRVMRSGYQMDRALGLKADGSIWDWPYHWEIAKAPVQFGNGVKEIAAGKFGRFAIREDGSLWSFEQYPIDPPPTQIGENFVHVVSGADHAYGIKADGSLWAWGNNNFHQLGDGTTTGRADPVKIGSGFVDVVTGRFHGLALGADGTLWAWGHNEVGVVGDGGITSRSVPVKIGSDFAKIAAGDFHNIALKSDGTLWAWGNNDDGQLGDGTPNRRFKPVQIGNTNGSTNKDETTPVNAIAKENSTGKKVLSVSVGLYYSCASLSDGQTKCWGIKENVQSDGREHDCSMLKNGRTNGHCIIECKTEVKKCEKIWARYPFLQDSTVIVNDFDIRCAIMKNGKVRCASSDNSSSERHIIDGVDDAISIDYRAGHGCALQANGLVKCWGDNSHGELGNGAKATDYSNYRSVATTVIGLD